MEIPKRSDKTETPNRTRPPLIEDMLEAEFYRARSAKALPDFVPENIHAAVQWWIGIMEPPLIGEEMRLVSGSTGKTRWKCSYQDRLVHGLRKFLDLKRADQDYILAAREDKIFWRGDAMWFFVKVVDESQRAQKMGIEAYKAYAKDKMRSALAKIGSRRAKETR